LTTSHSPRSLRDRTRREDRHLKFYELRDNLTGNAGDATTWNATVNHDPLGSTPTYTNGGSLAMATASTSGHLEYLTGTFAYRGGTITTLDPGANCTNQRYLVTGGLQNVKTRTTSGGTASFSVVLTHYRYSLFEVLHHLQGARLGDRQLHLLTAAV